MPNRTSDPVRGAISRRALLVIGATGVAGFSLGIHLHRRRKEAPLPEVGEPFAPDAWIRVDREGEVTIVIGQSEMGQGILTGLAMLVAEEMDADWSRVRVVQAPAHSAYANPLMPGQATGGSTSIRGLHRPLRRAGAAARTMFLAAAARQWGVEHEGCTVSRGTVTHPASGRSLTFGALAEAAAKEPIPLEPILKDPAAFQLVGRPTRRLDTRIKCTGEAGFGIDVAPPDHLVAVVARSPVFGGVVDQFDATETRRVPGVRAVYQIETGVAVIADGYWAAESGRKALHVTWRNPEPDLDIELALSNALDDEGRSARLDGDPAGEWDRALAGPLPRVVEAEYDLPFLAHATMEPMNCTASVTEEGVTVWAPTQYQMGPAIYGGGTRGVAARVAGVSIEQVTVHTTYLGGGFGRRSETDFVVEAVTLAMLTRRPVKVIWSREDDIRHDFYRPAVRHRCRAILKPDGQPHIWRHRIACPSIISRFLPSWLPERIANLAGPLKGGVDPTAVEGAGDLPYAVPHLEVTYHRARITVPVGFWRSVGHSHNAFVVESFVDELAQEAGVDPIEFRLQLLGRHPRHRAVLELAAREAGWGSPPGAGRARGVAVHASFGSYVAQIAEVSVIEGRVRVHRVTCAIDCGMIVNPDTVEAQMQGAIVYGLTAALFGKITLRGGAVQESNFHDYPLLRLPEAPSITVHTIRSEADPGGVGEPGTPPIAPAVSNALFALTGRRQRRLPLTA